MIIIYGEQEKKKQKLFEHESFDEKMTRTDHTVRGYIPDPREIREILIEESAVPGLRREPFEMATLVLEVQENEIKCIKDRSYGSKINPNDLGEAILSHAIGEHGEHSLKTIPWIESVVKKADRFLKIAELKELRLKIDKLLFERM